VLYDKGFASSSDHHSTEERKSFFPLTHEPFIVLLKHPIRTILVDSILRGAGQPSTIAESIRSILMDSHHTSTMQRNANATIAQNLRVGVVANLATILVSLTTNHPNCFSVCHKFPFRVGCILQSLPELSTVCACSENRTIPTNTIHDSTYTVQHNTLSHMSHKRSRIPMMGNKPTHGVLNLNGHFHSLFLFIYSILCIGNVKTKNERISLCLYICSTYNSSIIRKK